MFFGSARFPLTFLFGFEGGWEYEEFLSAQNPRFPYGFSGSPFLPIGIFPESDHRLKLLKWVSPFWEPFFYILTGSRNVVDSSGGPGTPKRMDLDTKV